MKKSLSPASSASQSGFALLEVLVSLLLFSFGVLGLIGLSALYGMASVDVAKAKAAEDKMYQAKVNALDIAPNPEKVSHDRKKAHEAKEQEEKEKAAEKKGTGE